MQDSPSLPEAAPSPGRDERRVRAAQDVLRTTIRDLYLGHFGAATTGGAMDVQLSLRVNPADNWALEFSPPLLEQLLPQLADREAARDVFNLGHVFCFRCTSSSCDHGRPPDGLHVFKGYDATGRPEWQEFSQTLIDVKDERVDQLYDRPPRLVALFQYGRELKGKQLATFGKASLSYSVLGQVVAGYFELNGERLALSLQIVEGRDREGRMTLKLNPVGYALDGAFLIEWLSLDKSAILFRAMQIAERELDRIEKDVRQARAAGEQDRANRALGRIPGVGRRLAEALSRGGRQEERRTRHAETRRKEQRPVHKALEDAKAAKPEHFYFDLKADTFVVVGEKGRVHAFNEEGKHVTSFMMKPATVAFRVRTERWRRATGEEVVGMRERL